MQWLAAISVKRPVFASVLILALTVIGAFSFSRLGLDRFPKVDFPTVVVTTRLPGAAPEEMETEISDKIEESVNTISGIDELRSTSSEGVSTVIISFLLEKDADIAAQEVRDRVNRVLPLLPKTIQQPPEIAVSVLELGDHRDRGTAREPLDDGGGWAEVGAAGSGDRADEKCRPELPAGGSHVPKTSCHGGTLCLGTMRPAEPGISREVAPGNTLQKFGWAASGHSEFRQRTECWINRRLTCRTVLRTYRP